MDGNQGVGIAHVARGTVFRQDRSEQEHADMKESAVD
jgi:hypothetical protein